MKVAGIGKIVEGINSVNSAINSNRVEKILFLESDKTTSNRLGLLIKKAKNKGLIVEKINEKEKWIYGTPGTDDYRSDLTEEEIAELEIMWDYDFAMSIIRGVF